MDQDRTLTDAYSQTQSFYPLMIRLVCSLKHTFLTITMFIQNKQN